MMITGSIPTILHKQFIISAFLCIITGYISFTLLTDNVINISFFTLKVVTDSLRIIRSITVFKNRLSGFYSQ